MSELQNDEIEWFLCYADGDCGLKSWAGPLLDRLQAEHDYGLATVEDGNFHSSAALDAGEDFRGDACSESETINEGGISSQLAQKVRRLAEKLDRELNIGVVQLSARARQIPSAKKPDPYSSGQCDFSDRTTFARARRCHERWRRLSSTARRVLAAWYLGMNPEAPAGQRVALQERLGQFCSVGYWTMSDEALASEHPALLRVKLELAVRAAHREWSADE